ncbi:MAG: PH domain-containing protein [Methanoregula sp.]|nr:PH domain-containing protein [Methanoregula sp.]
MPVPDHFPRNVPFKPSTAFIPWFIIDFLLVIAFISACTVVPVLFASTTDLYAVTVILGGLIAIIIVFVVWTRLYYDTMAYELHDDELRWRRGVWFRTTGIVPYNRITNLDLKQGPVMRWLGISSISIQTAGYSGQAVPEIRIEAIEHAEELRELLRAYVRSCSAGGDGTGTSGHSSRPVDTPVASIGTSMLILDELKKIRMLLEQQKK